MGIGTPGAKNAALLAVEILALADEGLAKKLDQYRTDMRRAVTEEDESIRNA
jgi:phosphoribosylcarboxyaminoimidazole (NCAIR) mutase